MVWLGTLLHVLILLELRDRGLISSVQYMMPILTMSSTGMAAYPASGRRRRHWRRNLVHASHQVAARMVFRETRPRRRHHLLRDRCRRIRVPLPAQHPARQGGPALDAAYLGPWHQLVFRYRPIWHEESFSDAEVQPFSAAAQVHPSPTHLPQERSLLELRTSVFRTQLGDDI